MKKLIIIMLAAAMLVIPSTNVSAITLDDTNAHWMTGVHTDGLNNDANDQAELLKELGLFLGTEKGFELDRSMTRAEAAVMLVRFLGAEKKVLDGTWNHPFTDVPQWADKYIGWLYQSGLTQGISKIEYGAKQNITLEQYAVFLSRAVCGDDNWKTNGIATADEVELWDKSNGFFTRAAAVGLSTRALTITYTRNGNYTYTMAQYLIDHGVFTAEQFLEAAWGILPPVYRINGDGHIDNILSGVTVGRTDAGGLIGITGTDSSLTYFYAWSTQGKNVTLYKIDCKTMENTLVSSTTLLSDNDEWTYTYASTIEGKDYLFEHSYPTQRLNLVEFDGDQLTTVLSDLILYEDSIYPHLGRNYHITDASMLIAGPEQYYFVDKDGIREHTYAAGTQPLGFEGTSLITQLVTEENTMISCLCTVSNAIKDSYTVAQDMPDTYDRRTVEPQGYGRFYGEAGLYVLDSESGRLEQITTRPTLDVTAFRMDNRYIILTHNLGKRVRTANGSGGDLIVIIDNDGKERILLDNKPTHGIDINSFDKSIAHGNTVGFCSADDMGMQHFNIYYYILMPSFGAELGQYDEGQPAIIVTGYSAGRPELEVEGYEEVYIQKEQARLDTLGYGH